MMIYELDDIEAGALLDMVVDRAADLNDGKPLTEMQREQRSMDAEVDEIKSDVDWLTGLPARFPTHRSAQRFRDLLTKIANASVYDPGESDLDDEQSISLRISLGDVRMARRLLR